MEPVTTSGARQVGLLRQTRNANKPYDLVLTDAHMPETDGYALAEWIKQAPELGSTVVMMLTSGDQPGDGSDGRRGEQQGIAAYLRLPEETDSILAR